MSNLINKDVFLCWRGWKTRDGIHWHDPIALCCGDTITTDEAVGIQITRDDACATFVRSMRARQVLRECEEYNRQLPPSPQRQPHGITQEAKKVEKR